MSEKFFDSVQTRTYFVFGMIVITFKAPALYWQELKENKRRRNEKTMVTLRIN